MKSFLIVSLAVLFIQSITAKDFKMVSVLNKHDKTTFDIYIVGGEDNEAVGLKMFDRKEKEWTHFETTDLKKGATIKEFDSHKVALLKSKDFEADRGGHFNIDYLNNAITGKRKNFPMKLDFDGTKWTCFHRGEKVKELSIDVKKVLGQVVGIKKIDVTNQ